MTPAVRFGAVVLLAYWKGHADLAAGLERAYAVGRFGRAAAVTELRHMYGEAVRLAEESEIKGSAVQLDEWLHLAELAEAALSPAKPNEGDPAGSDEEQRAVGDERLDWNDTDAVKAWAVHLGEHVADAVDAGLDATAPLAERMLGRKAAREEIASAKKSIRQAFEFSGLLDDDDEAGAAAPTKEGDR